MNAKLAGAMWGIILATSAFLPLFVWPGAKERFRVPKEALFRGEAVVLLALALIGFALRGRMPRIDWRDPPVAVTALAVAWTAVATLASLNRALSVESLITVAASAVVFLATYWLAPRRSTLSLAALLVPATINSALVIVQELGIWNPFSAADSFQGHQRSTALVGNPNDVGSYLVAPALMAAAAAIAFPARRLLLGSAAVLFAAGIVFSQTMTALGALLAGLAVILVAHAPRRAAVALGILAAAALAAALLYRPLGSRLQSMVRLIAAGEYNQLLTYRIPPFLAAATMLKDRPLLGVGPGGFAYHYFDYRIEQPARYDEALVAMPSSEQFGEVHDDHLQVLAETGVPGYLVLVAALVVLASAWRSPNPFARCLGPTLAASWFVLALAQFPLQLAAPRLTFLHLAAVTLAWRGDANR